jgi:hypothetical protein
MTARRVLCSGAMTGGMSVPGRSKAIPVAPMTLARLLGCEPGDAAEARELRGLDRATHPAG